ncbi:bcl-2-like protein 10 [Tupaia chinensis]|uniref:bcl-2-like protein 10 n=1 Tax=Tupaia chinensis TaxID=246437 RepID=UPI000703EFE5|nr:bcl-2-like protein 10 [Tupaia chinensis]
MADPLKARTERLLTDYLGYCAREPGAPEPQPSSPEAAVLRSTAAQLQRLHQPFFARGRGYPGNPLELLGIMSNQIVLRSLFWQDGFCLFFRTSSPLISWRRLLIQAFLSCLLATALIYSWTRLL